MTFWTYERVAELRRGVADGMTSAELGAQLGTTKNAIIGKAGRVGLQLLGRSGNNMKPPKKPRKSPQVGRAFYAPAEPLPPTDAPRAIPPAPNSKPVDLMGLNNSTCHWPLWDEPYEPMLYCGALEADVDAGRSYCWFHARAAKG
jgi:GcrA cell cycle regulator